MSDDDDNEFESAEALDEAPEIDTEPTPMPMGAEPAGSPNLDAILGIPVSVQVVIGGATMPVADLMKLTRGAVIPLDQRVGQPVDIMVNGRLIARGEMVVIDEEGSRLGVSLTEVLGQATPARAA